MPTLAELYRALKGYAKDALPGGNLNPETKPVADRARYIGGLLGDAISTGVEMRGSASGPLAPQHAQTLGGLLMDFSPLGDVKSAYDGFQSAREGDYLGAGLGALGALPMVPNLAGLGHIAYHGSPHKFDKFSLDKIGTGEGAQTYGHGLYLAEAPEVARNYMNHGPNHVWNGDGTNAALKQADAVAKELGIPIQDARTIAKAAFNTAANPNWGTLNAAEKNLKFAIEDSESSIMHLLGGTRPDMSGEIAALQQIEKLKKAGFDFNTGNNLYKTDIPDEAVARFLDWDKPLSQQAPEVQKAFAPILERTHGRTDIGPISQSTREYLDFVMRDKSAGEIIQSARTGALKPEEIAETLKAGGIPGIRYLDGGSRSAGQGSSNFVVFDPEMIRILERNGQPTGQKPWGLGEWLQRMQPQN